MNMTNIWPGWETVRLIGNGSFGAVYEIEREVFGEKEKAALKVITIPQSENDIEELRNDGYGEESITARFQSYLQDIVREYTLMAKMKGCANIVYCDDVKYVQHDDGIGWDIFIKMELLTALPRALGNGIPEEQAVRVGRDICSALVFCEKRNLLHRDIKPQNIFVAPDGTCKLGDFGIAKTAERTTGGTKTGTYKYMAPEVYNNRPYGAKADIYSLGLVLYWLLNERRTPFLPLPPETPSSGDEDRARARRFAGEMIGAPAHGSPELQRIVLKACAYDPQERYQSAEEMLRDLEALTGSTAPSARTGVPDGTQKGVPTPAAPVGRPDDGTVGIWGDRPAAPRSKPQSERRSAVQGGTVNTHGQRRPENSKSGVFCRYCGAPMPSGTKYCTRCGAAQTKSGSGKGKVVLAALSALLVIAVVIAVVAWLGKGEAGGTAKPAESPAVRTPNAAAPAPTPEPAPEPTPVPTPEPTPVPTPESNHASVSQPPPGPNDMAGFSDIEAPQAGSWLPARETRYICARGGVSAYLFARALKEPKSNENIGYVLDGTEVSLLAAENNHYLVKVSDGRLGWVGESQVRESRLIDTLPQLVGTCWIYSKGAGDAYTYVCKFESEKTIVGFRLSDGKKSTWSWTMSFRQLRFDGKKLVWNGEMFVPLNSENQSNYQFYMEPDPDRVFEKYS